MPDDLDTLLAATPYLVPGDRESLRSYERVRGRSLEVAGAASRALRQIGASSTVLMDPFMQAIRSDLVAESNKIEGYDVTRKQIEEAVSNHKELLDGPVHNLLEALRADQRIVIELGLYKAQLLAEEWAHAAFRPRAFELRQLHSVIVGDENIGGRYRERDVAIGGTTFRPPPHFDVPRSMSEFAQWWQTSSKDPILDATIAHAWLTHIHPFDDGNGRLARVLANLALAQASYPALVIRAETDRGQYYDALALSDEGNILPLYDLFARIIRRTVKVMSRPNYAQDVLQYRLLSSVSGQRTAWLAVMQKFFRELSVEFEKRGWSLTPQGYPDSVGFSLLGELNPDGNSWFAVIRDNEQVAQFLLWFGYNSSELCDLLGGEATGYPSIYISTRDTSAAAVHPYVHLQGSSRISDEILVKPLEARPVTLRYGFDSALLTIEQSVSKIAASLV